MKKVAILGATGYVGRSLVPEFLSHQDAYELFLFSRSEAILRTRFGELASVHMHDMTAFPLSEYDVIINCTGMGNTKELKDKPAEIFEVTNAVDTFIISHLEKHPATLYVNLSSGAAYGDNFKEPVTAETKAVFNINAFNVSEYYAIAKLHAEARHRALAHLHIVDLRIFAFFSRFVDTDTPFLMSDIARAIVHNATLDTPAEDIMRDYVCPQDLFSLISRVIEAGDINDAFDVYSADAVSKFELLRYLAERRGLRYSLNESYTPTFKHTYCSDNRKAAVLGYSPSFTSLTGIDAELEALLAISHDKAENA